MTVPHDAPAAERVRALPAVDSVLRSVGERAGAAAAARATLDDLRRSILAGTHAGPVPDVDAVAARVRARLGDSAVSAYPRVVNGTGVFLHTGLGRAPLSPLAAEALSGMADGFAVVEVDPASGERRHREHAVVADLCALTGAEAATVVNNNAAALLLALTTLAEGKDVLVSRGELIEIGGGFRLPDLLARSGAHMVEVGTTNRTYADDYGQVLTWETGLVLVMHTSNYRVEGFQHSPSREELVALTREAGVPVLEDTGSGLLAPLPGCGLDDEPDATRALAAGVDLVCFSGDKLLGGPQAGILVGRAELVERCRRHPLFRAVRPDRLALAALAATLRLHRMAPGDVPVLAAMGRSEGERQQRARELAAVLAARFADAAFTVVSSEAEAGSGSAPARTLPSAAVEVQWPGCEPEVLARALRVGRPSVFGRIWRGRFRIDVHALLPGDEVRLVDAFAALQDDGAPS